MRPDFDPGSPDDPITYLPEFELTDRGSGRYEGTYNNLDIDGRFIITIYAKDVDELLSDPKQVGVMKNVAIVPGDINDDSTVDLADLVLALQVLSGVDPQGLISNYAVSGVDVDGDDLIGLAEVIYIMQYVAGLR